MAASEASGEVGGTGLSKQIRSSGISETYDLAGFGEAQAKYLIRDTFGQPIRASEPLRIVFVIGGGKTQNRQRYDNDLGRYVSAALREVGYREDRAATALMECQGTFKSQHDTHKGIRSIQVFPKVELVEKNEGDGEKGHKSRLTATSPEYMCAVCAFDIFQEMVEEKVRSWSQKKRLLRHLNSLVVSHKEAEAKLTRMEALTDDEQDLYDNIDPDIMDVKVAWLTSLIKGMVENGRLTAVEHNQVLAQVQSKLQALSEEQEKATMKEDEKALARIHKQAQNLTNRRSMVLGHTPIAHKVKHQDELRGITVKLLAIEKIESTRGRLLTIDEAKKVGAKQELLDRAKVLEADSRGWFEEDEELEVRLAEVRRQGQRMVNKSAAKGAKASAGGKGGGAMAMDSDGWSRAKR